MARFTLQMPDGTTHVLSLHEVDVLISSDGYVRTKHEYGSSMELILSFDQVVSAMEEERDLWQ
jgi:hypothetical protein